jgi:uncharacterized protein
MLASGPSVPGPERMSDLLVVFVKSPRPGFVKTRLAAAVGAVHAAALYRAMAERVLEATRGDGHGRAVFFDPPDGRADVEAWLPGETCVAQSAGDLGVRMASAFRWAFDGGATKVVLIGTDAPELSRDDIERAFEALGGHDVVLGPSFDGGYYLIGLRQPAPALFDGITWSTPAVLGQTLELAESLGLTTTPLPARGDVDTVEDLRREWPRMKEWLPRGLAEPLAVAMRD